MTTPVTDSNKSPHSACAIDNSIALSAFSKKGKELLSELKPQVSQLSRNEHTEKTIMEAIELTVTNLMEGLEILSVVTHHIVTRSQGSETYPLQGRPELYNILDSLRGEYIDLKYELTGC